jgi:hypothetical protein
MHQQVTIGAISKNCIFSQIKKCLHTEKYVIGYKRCGEKIRVKRVGLFAFLNHSRVHHSFFFSIWCVCAKAAISQESAGRAACCLLHSASGNIKTIKTNDPLLLAPRKLSIFRETPRIK